MAVLFWTWCCEMWWHGGREHPVWVISCLSEHSGHEYHVNSLFFLAAGQEDQACWCDSRRSTGLCLREIRVMMWKCCLNPHSLTAHRCPNIFFIYYWAIRFKSKWTGIVLMHHNAAEGIFKPYIATKVYIKPFSRWYRKWYHSSGKINSYFVWDGR